MKLSSETIRAVEDALSNKFGGRVRIGKTEDLTNSGRSHVYRFGVEGECPSCVIVKQAAKPGEVGRAKDFRQRLLIEWSGLQFLTEKMGHRSVAPQFYVGYRDCPFVVMEDLGQNDTLIDILNGQDAKLAEKMLIRFARTVGKMHAGTAGQMDAFGKLESHLGVARSRRTKKSAGESLLGRFEAICSAAQISPARGWKRDIREVGNFTSVPNDFWALTHGDLGPGHDMIVGSSMKLFDFEGCAFGHALRDGALPRIHFGTAWFTNRMPDRVVKRMEDTYRAELAKGCPAAAKDDLFYKALVEGCALWTVHTFAIATSLEQLFQKGAPDDVTDDCDEDFHWWSVFAVRRRVLLRLGILVGVCNEFDHLRGVGKTAGHLIERLRDLWPEGTHEMPLYPVFRE